MENKNFVELNKNALFEVQGGGVVAVIGCIVIVAFTLGALRGCAAEDKKNGYK